MVRLRESTERRSLRHALLTAGAVGALVVAAVPGVRASDQPPLGVQGFATGQTLHAGALESGGTRLLNSELAWAGASVDDAALTPERRNEMNRVFQPALADKHSYARASALEVGLATTPDDENQVQQAAKTESSAPPPTSAEDELRSLDADPAAFASLLRSNTAANWNQSGIVPGVCVLPDDISRGYAYAASAELLDADGSNNGSEGLEQALLSLHAEDPSRSVSQTTTRTRLVPTGKGPNNFGLMSEVRQTIAPITILADETDPNALRLFTIEFLGEWVLRVTATGHDGGATVHYGPGEASPETPLLRVIDEAGDVVGQLTTQQIFGDEGFDTSDLGIPPNLLQVTIGEDPRAIADPGTTPDGASQPTLAEDGTFAAAAVDVVRVKLLSQPDPEASDIRVGHMEVSAKVPAGGVDCAIPVDKTANPTQISVGHRTTLAFKVENPYDCRLENVVLTDQIRQQEADPRFRLVSSDRPTRSPSLPTAADQIAADVVWDLGTIPPGGETTVTLVLEATSGGGIVRDIATATGSLAACKGTDVEGFAVARVNLTGVSPLVKVAIELPRTGGQSAATAATGTLLALVATALATTLRRRVT